MSGLIASEREPRKKSNTATPAEVARMRALRDQGWSYSAIAREVGRGRHSVRYWLDPGFRERRQTEERHRDAGTRRPESAEEKARRNERRRQRRSDPAYRARELERQRQRHRERLATDPAYRARYRAAKAAQQRRHNALARAALRAKRQEIAARRAVRKAGGAIAEAYAMAERMQDVLGQAHRDATDPARRRHLSVAGEHYRQMRDEIVRALGVDQ